MSYSIENGKILVVQGDSLWLDLRVLEDGEAYVPDNDDELSFIVTDSDGNVALTVELPIDLMELYLTPEQTEALKADYEYQYSITLNDSEIASGFITCTKEVI